MVRRVLDIVYKEVRGLHQAAYVLALFAFGSQLLALLRDRLLAHQFGAGYELDLYYAAFRVPDLMYVLFASTLSVYVLIPFVTRAREQDGNDRGAQELLSQIFSAFLIAYIFLAVCIAFSAPYVIETLFPSLTGDERLVLLLRILLLQPLFLGISSLFGVVTQLGHRFVLYALSPLLYNIGIIFGIVALEPFFGLPGLACGVVLGALAHMAIQFPLVRSSSLSFFFTLRLSRKLLFSVFRVSIPRAFALSVNQIVLLVFISIASVMTVGSVSVFQFAHNLQSVPLAMIGVSYSVAAFPMLAEFCSRKEFKSFNVHITTALRHILFWAFPAIALIVVLRAHVVRIVLGSGAFDWNDTRLTAAVFSLLALSLVAQAVNLLAIRAFYAGGYTRIPFIVSLLGGGFAIIFAFSMRFLYSSTEWFAPFLKVIMRLTDVPGTEVLTLAIGYTAGMLLQAVLLLILLWRTYHTPFGTLGRSFTTSLAAAVVTGVVSYTTLNFVVVGINPEKFMGIFIQGTIGSITGVVAGMLTYRILRSPELKEVLESFHRKLFRTDVVAPQQDIL